MPNFEMVSPELFMLFMCCTVLLTSVAKLKGHSQRICYGLTQLALIGAAILTFRLFSTTVFVLFNGHFVLDRMASIMKLFVYLTSMGVFVYSRRYIEEREIPFGEYYVLGLFAVLGMQVLISAGSFLTLYLGVEILALPLYALVAIQRDVSITTEAAIKYFVMGAVASGMLLYGISLIYGVTHNLQLSIVGQQMFGVSGGYELVLLFGLVFLVTGIAFKFGAVPFHMWVPDVYQGAPVAVTSFITSAPKIAALALAVRLLAQASPQLVEHWQQLLIILSLGSMILGNLAAIAQTNIKRMLAYSSITHIGYMLLGLLTATVEGFASSLFYMIIYAIMSLGAFGVLVVLSKGTYEIENIKDLQGLNSKNSWLALLMLFLMFSMAGIPPLAGFIAKLAVIQALIHSGFVWLAAIALVFSVIGSYYYLRVVQVMYFEEPLPGGIVATLPNFDTRIVLSINGVLILLLGIFPGSLISLCKSAFG